MLTLNLVTMTAFVPKDVAIKIFCCCKESYMEKMISKKDFVLFLFSHKTYVA